MPQSKMQVLQTILHDLGSVVVAFSGGVDSTFLLKVASLALPGDKLLAINAGGEIYPASERASVDRLAESIGVQLMHLDPLLLDTPAFRDNPPDRCYHCKRAIFSQMQQMGLARGLMTVVDGSNLDDLRDFRPGKRASQELGIRSPLEEAGFTKSDIRHFSRELGLPTWDKPSMACLASRFPYGDEVTKPKLLQVEQAEELLKAWGFAQYRVRHHGSVARVEVLPEEMSQILSRRVQLLQELRRLGFDYVALDLQGYRTGAMNEALRPEEQS